MINEDKDLPRKNLPNEEEIPRGLPVRDFWPEADEVQKRIDESARRSLTYNERYNAYI